MALSARDKLLNQLESYFAMFVYSILTPTLFAADVSLLESSPPVQLRDKTRGLARTIPNAGPGLAMIFSHERDRKALITEIEVAARQAIIAKTHEAIVAYCARTEQVRRYCTLDWYDFSVVLRNSVSHGDGGEIRWESKRLQARKSVKWRHRVITREMAENGELLRFSNVECLEWFEDQLAFAKTLK